MAKSTSKTDTKSRSTTKDDGLPSTKPDLVALAIDNGTPSYEAWAMTVDDLTKLLEED